MANARLALHDLRDAYAFAGAVVREKLPALNGSIPEEEAVQLFVVKLWRRSLRYDASRGVPFSAYASRYGGAILVDVVRELSGRTKWKWSDGSSYERKHVELVPLHGDGDGGGLDEALAGEPTDFADGRALDLRGVLGERDSGETWPSAA